VNRIGRSTIICLLIATAPIWALLARKLSSQLLEGAQILKVGTISFDGSEIDCLVRKMSGYGANLEVESQIGIPNSFDLVIDTEQSNHHCHVIWRKARRIGIAFD